MNIWRDYFDRHQIDLMLNISDYRRRATAIIKRKFPGISFDVPEPTYKRYGYSECHFVAAMLAKEIHSGSVGHVARLANCGMAALSNTIEALKLKGDDLVVASTGLYSMTRQCLEKLRESGMRVEYSDPIDIPSKMREAFPALVVAETVTNGCPIEALPVSSVFDAMRDSLKTYFILDNSVCTPAVVNPYKQLHKHAVIIDSVVDRFVYVESLSKFYRQNDGVDRVTAGIVMASPTIISAWDDICAFRGNYLQPACLLELPESIIDCATRTALPAARSALEVACFLRNMMAEYPDPKIGVSHPISDAAGVDVALCSLLYLDLPTKSLGDVIAFVRKAGFEERGSYGHPRSTALILSRRGWRGVPIGRIRLSIGYQDQCRDLIVRLEQAIRSL